MLAASTESIEALLFAVVASHALLLGAFELIFRRALASTRRQAAWPWLVLFALSAGYSAWRTWSGRDNPFQLKVVLVCAVVLPVLAVATVRDVMAVTAWRRSR
jgi:hypothetical protein